MNSNICDAKYRKEPYCQKLYIGWFFTSLLYLYVMNADHEFAVLHWNYASAQDTAGYSELKSIDGNFPTFEIDQNEPISVWLFTSRALILQELVIYFDQSAEDPAKYSKIAKFFSPDANPCCKCVKEY